MTKNIIKIHFKYTLNENTCRNCNNNKKIKKNCFKYLTLIHTFEFKIHSFYIYITQTQDEKQRKRKKKNHFINILYMHT